MNVQPKPLDESPFLLACRRQPVPYTPVWYMRQAGRSLPEYRRARGGMPMLKACSQPDVITEITLQPTRRYPVNAAILFSDIVVPLRAVGLDIDIKPGVGPVIGEPIRGNGIWPGCAPWNRATWSSSPRRSPRWSGSWDPSR